MPRRSHSTPNVDPGGGQTLPRGCEIAILTAVALALAITAIVLAFRIAG